jgi:hypothetical protein
MAVTVPNQRTKKLRTIAMLKSLSLAAAAAAALTAATPVVAQSAQDEARFTAAQQRFDAELARYRAEVDRYRASRGGYTGTGGYREAPAANYYNNNSYPGDRDENGYDPSRYYRSGDNYRERVLSADERVYAGNDGRYYCKRSDGTTGLVIGGAAGGILGNVIDGGRSRIVGTLLGGAAGALAGKAIDQNQSQVRCR